MTESFFRLFEARSCRRQKETRQPTVGPRGRGPEAMCSRAFHDAVGASGPASRIPGVPSARIATRYRRGTGRRDSAFRVAKHLTYKHGEKQYAHN